MLPTKWIGSGALLTTMLALGVSGCGGGGGNQSTSSTSASAAGGTPASGGSTANAPKAITIAMADQQKTLDPTQFETRPLLARANEYAGTLTTPDWDGKKVTPGLAESWKEGPRSWKFKLRPNLKFSDGTPLTAGDVAASFNYYRHRKDDVNSYALDGAAFKRARALSDREVEFTTTRPSPRLPFVLAEPYHPVVPAAKVADPKAAKKFLASKLVSAGRYMVKSTSPVKTVLEANPHYWGPKPVIKQMTWVTNSDGAARLAQVKAGQADYADDLPAQAAPQLTGSVHPSYTTDAFGGELLMMNTRKGFPTHSLKLRQAISAGVDRSQISKILYGGKVQPQLGLFPKTSEYSDPFVRPTADVAKAKSLVAQSGCKAPCSMKITFLNSVPDQYELAQLIAQQLGAIGLKVDVERLDDSVFFDRASKGNFDLIVTGPYGFFAEDYMNYIIPTDGGGPATYTGWAGGDPYETKWQTAGGAQFKQVVKQVLAKEHADMPFVPTVGVGYMGGSRVPDSVFSQSPLLYFPVAPRNY